ncbi:MAG: fibronectin type III domain-containing protein [Fimbriimonas sp.]
MKGRLPIFFFSLVFVLLTAAASFAFQAGNPQIPPGGTATFPKTGTDGPANSEAWDVINASGTVVAKASVPAGWTVVLNNSNFTVTVPVGTTVANNYKVRSTESGIIIAPGGFGLKPGAGLRRPRETKKPVPTATARTASGSPVVVTAQSTPVGPPPPPGGNPVSATFDVIAPPPPPPSPSNLQLFVVAKGRIEMNWQDNSTTETGFRIYRSYGTIAYTLVGTVGPDVNYFADATVDTDNIGVAGARYRITAFNGSGESSPVQNITYQSWNFTEVDSHLGTDFWFTFPGNEGFGEQLRVYISAPRGASGTVEIPGTGFTQTFSIPAGGGTQVAVPSAAELNGSDATDSNGVHVISDNPVAVHGLNALDAQTDGFLAMPTSMLEAGEHVALCWPTNMFGSNGTAGLATQLSMVATQDATSVTIVPSVRCGSSRAARVPYTITLNRGQTYQLRSYTLDADLTGTLVTATKPIAVYGGAQLGFVPKGIPYGNLLVEGLPARSRWSAMGNPVVIPAGRNAVSVRVMASFNGTVLKRNGTVVATLNRGEVFQEAITANAFYKPEGGPILLAQFAQGHDSDFAPESDPTMIVPPSTDAWRSNYAFHVPDTVLQSYVDVVIHSSRTSLLRVDARPIPSTEFTPLYAGSDLSRARVTLPPGTHYVCTNTGNPADAFLAVGYGFGSYDAYGWSLGRYQTPAWAAEPVTGVSLTLATTAPAYNRVRLDWTLTAPATPTPLGFRVERKSGSGDWSQIAYVPGGSVRQWDDTTVVKLTSYTYRIRAAYREDSPYSNESTVTTPDSPPNPPTNLTGSSPAYDRVNLIWADASNNETGFQIERKTGATGTWAPVTTVAANVTTYENVGLTKKTEYVYRVRSSNASGTSAWSNEAVVTTKDTPPNAPTALVAVGNAWNQATLTWQDNSNNEESFRIEMRVGAGAYSEIGSVGTNVTTFVYALLDGNTQYTFRVRARNDGGDSGYSNEAVLTTVAPPVPAAPTTLVATPSSDTQISLTWTDASISESGFDIQRRLTSSSTWANVGSAAKNATAWSDSGLTASTGYTYRVRAVNSTGSSAWSNEASATTFAAGAGAAMEVISIATSANSVGVYWKAFPGAVNYIINRATNENGPFTPLAPASSPVDPGPGLTNRFLFRDTSVTSGTTYYYEVVPVMPGGALGPGSNIPSAIPDPSAIPWDGTAMAIIMKANQVHAGSVSGWDWNGMTMAVGPNGCVTVGRATMGLAFTHGPTRSIASGTNLIDDASRGLSYPKPMDGQNQNLAQSPVPNEMHMTDGHGTGPSRKVEAVAGYTTFDSMVFLPPIESTATAPPHWNTQAKDTAWIYTGGDGNAIYRPKRGVKETKAFNLDIGFSKGEPDQATAGQPQQGRTQGWGPDGWFLINNARTQMSLTDDQGQINPMWNVQDRVRVQGWVRINMALPNGTGAMDQRGVFTVNTSQTGGTIVNSNGTSLGITSFQCTFALPDIHNVASTGSDFRIKRVNAIAQKTDPVNYPANFPTGAQIRQFHQYAGGAIIANGAWGNEFDEDGRVRVGGNLLEGTLVNRAGSAPGPPGTGPTAVVSRTILTAYSAEKNITVRTKSP